MAHYVDGFVVPVPRDKLDAYQKVAGRGGRARMRMFWGGFKRLVEFP